MLLLVFIELIITITLNYYFGKFYGIRIEDKTIVFENMWKKMHYPTSELKDIRRVRFIIPYPLNPHLKFVLKNDKTYISIMNHRFKNYLKKGGINQYIKDLKNTFLDA